MMHTEALLALYDKEMRVEVEYTGLMKEDLGHVVRFTGKPDIHGGNYVLYSRLNAANADQIIREQIAYYEGIGHPFEWKAYEHDAPTDLIQRLVGHGFAIREEKDAIMALDLAQTPRIFLEPVSADVRKLETPEQLSELLPVLEPVWNESFAWIHQVLGDEMRQNPDYLSVYVAYVNNQPACTAWANYHTNSQFASLWGGSTLPQYRRQGLYTAVMAARVQEAIRRGYRFLTIDASPMNHPIAERRGFRLLTYAYACMWEPGQVWTDD